MKFYTQIALVGLLPAVLTACVAPPPAVAPDPSATPIVLPATAASPVVDAPTINTLAAATPIAGVTPSAIPMLSPRPTQNPEHYKDANYGFTLAYPPAWTLAKVADQHLVRLRQGDYVLNIGVRRADEESLIMRTGVGAGDLIERGHVKFLGQELTRDVLSYEGRDKAVLYNRAGEVAVGDLRFTLSLDYDPGEMQRPAPYAAQVLTPQTQAECDRIVASIWK